MSKKLTVAAAQIEPEYHDKDGTVNKTCKWIEKAGKKDVDLIVFPEAHIPGYPYWGRNPSGWNKMRMELQENSLSKDDDQIDIISESIEKAGLYAVIGVNELDDRRGSETIYNSLFYFSPSGDFMGRHRKLMPTAHERMIWGMGDPSNIRVFDTDIGNIGGLICYENHMTLSKAALTAMGEEIHVAAWPGFWTLYEEKYAKAETEEDIKGCDIYPAVREYAFETQNFVISCSPYIGKSIPEKYEEKFFFNFGTGGSMIVDPFGIVKEGPVLGEEKLVVSEINFDKRKAIKSIFDSMGHYSRWDAINLNINTSEYSPISPNTKEKKIDMKISENRIKKISEKENISQDKVKSIIQSLSREKSYRS